MHQPRSTIVLGDKDNVAIALKAILKDDPINELGLSAKTDIPKGHKVAKQHILIINQDMNLLLRFRTSQV